MEEAFMLTKTKIAAGGAARAHRGPPLPLASEGRAPPHLLWFGGGGVPVGYAPGGYAPIGYASYVVQTRHGPRVCHRLAEYTDWGFYVGDNYGGAPPQSP